MKRQAYQHPELRDENDNIIQEGTYGKESPLVNSTNDGVLDYINNNLEALYDNINGSRIYVANKAALPATGDLSAMYIAEDTGKWYLWDGTKYIETDNARKIADEAIAARDAAKASANDAANSAREQQADWNVTDTTSKAYVKNKPEVVTYKRGAYEEVLEWEDNCIQSVFSALATDHPPDAYNYGLQVTLGKIGQDGGASAKLYFPHNGGMFLKNFWGPYNSSGWLTMLHDRNFSIYALPKNGTAVKATADAAGNNIQNTYAKKSDLSSSVSTKALTVTGETSVPTANEGNSSNTIASTEFVAKSIAKLVDSAPDSLNTLNELAKALGDDPNFATTVLNELAKKLNSAEAENTYVKQGGVNLWDALHNNTTSNLKGLSNAQWNALGFFIRYFSSDNNFENQPTTYGQLINISADKSKEATQLFIAQHDGQIYFRGGNASTAMKDVKFKAVAYWDDNGHLKFPNGAEMWVY